MKRAFWFSTFILLLSIGSMQAQSKKEKGKCDSCKVEKRDSCKSMKVCPFCKDVEREKKLAKIKGAAHTLPLPLDSTRCDKCKKNTPNKGIQKISRVM